MPNVAAVPVYVGQDFSDAAPGHRFNLYFPIWRTDWTVDKSGKAQAIRAVTALPDAVKKLLQALRDRQQKTLAAHPHSFSLPAKSTAPFATGLGNEHPVENGFAFLTPYGLPYLAGSGVKGVLRRAAEELALFGDEYTGESALTPTPLPRGEGLSMLDVWWLFGFEGAAGAWWPLSRKEERDLSQEQKSARADWKARFDNHLATLENRPDWLDFIERVLPKGSAKARYLSDPALFVNALDRLHQEIHLRGALDVWDVFPQPPSQGPHKDKLAVEIMTPHYTDYYQGKSTPHDAGQPTPIPFLAVPAGSSFEFHVVCQPNRLPEHLGENWKEHLQAIFEHAFDWLGFGAKTAVGYGAMTEDTETQRRREKAAAEQAAQQAEASRRAAMSPNQIRIEEFRKACDKRVQELRGANKEKQNTGIHQLAQKLAKDARENPDWTPEEKRSVAEALEEWLPQIVERMDKDARKKLKLSELRGQPA